MSQELLDLLKWLAVLFGASAAYRSLGDNIASVTHALGLLSCYILAYLGAGGLIVLVFALIKRVVGGKLLGSDIFGHAEYYLGMVSGALRYSCVLLTVLALINARYFNPAEIKRMADTQKDVYGSELFPTLRSLQVMIFDRSLTGPLVKKNLGFLLIKPTPSENRRFQLREAMPLSQAKRPNAPVPRQGRSNLAASNVGSITSPRVERPSAAGQRS